MKKDCGQLAAMGIVLSNLPGDADDVHGFRLADERLETGEYVSLSTDDQMHTYVVARSEPV